MGADSAQPPEVACSKVLESLDNGIRLEDQESIRESAATVGSCLERGISLYPRRGRERLAKALLRLAELGDATGIRELETLSWRARADIGVQNFARALGRLRAAAALGPVAHGTWIDDIAFKSLMGLRRGPEAFRILQESGQAKGASVNLKVFCYMTEVGFMSRDSFLRGLLPTCALDSTKPDNQVDDARVVAAISSTRAALDAAIESDREVGAGVHLKPLSAEMRYRLAEHYLHASAIRAMVDALDGHENDLATLSPKECSILVEFLKNKTFLIENNWIPRSDIADALDHVRSCSALPPEKQISITLLSARETLARGSTDESLSILKEALAQWRGEWHRGELEQERIRILLDAGRRDEADAAEREIVARRRQELGLDPRTPAVLDR